MDSGQRTSTSRSAVRAALVAERAEATRSALVAAARRLFVEKGYFDTSTEEVVAAAGVGTRGALYHHFADKKALFLTVFEQVEEDVLAAADTATTSSGDALARLRHGLLGFLDASLQPEVQRILLIDGPAVLGWREWRAIEERYGLGAIHALLDLAVTEGTVPAQPLNALAHILLAAIDEAALFIASADDPAAAKDQAVAAVDQLLTGLKVTNR
ncbi:TetR/AcrR family transcriptional regulator [Frankia sp. Cas4]|uniref:TetR/AcrR family transcriptional regulator n=1 Tax=Frankia sp. Cas4 TaxID=3073927 RepID=UPI002AD24E5A|nr:TetR/AcrR family transcriptional regulator [Frankia sp. Cas4]